tara:strand:+ start:622 stop:1032 length:411 start_codon:yes stop_codon:yes gene_type:complete
MTDQYNPSSSKNITTNLPIEPLQSLDNSKKTLRIFGDYFDKSVTVDSAEYDAMIAFFTGKDYDQQSAETISYVIARQAKIDQVSGFSILDQLTNTDPQELTDIVAEILNLYRFKSSLIGKKTTNETPDVISRNIIG